jgi:hypothetical protein
LILLLGFLMSECAWAGSEGVSSTFYGQGAGAVNTGGANAGGNAFFGYQAGYENTGGYGNAFVGPYTGSTNTTGYDNAFLGLSSGYSNTTGYANAFHGAESGFSNTTGYENAFHGAESGYHNTTGHDNAFFGFDAGLSNSTGNYNAFFGTGAGGGISTGSNNTLVGAYALFSNSTGQYNTVLGYGAGHDNSTGSGNVLLGFKAGITEAGSNKLYVDNCFSGGGCTSPFIYGEFDNHVLKLNGMTEVHYNGLSKSQLNFSVSSNDNGGFLTSVLDNNFFMSSGARYDGTLVAPNQWVQRSSDGKSVIQGSGSLGYRVFTSQGNSVGTGFTPAVRLLIDYNGLFALNANSTVAGHEIHTSSGAYLTTSGTWTNASSRSYKQNIEPLGADAAEKTLQALQPVTFRYRNDTEQQRVGFIAEDVPDLVAMKDRKGLSAMDIVAVLTKVVQGQERALDEKSRIIESLEARLEKIEALLRRR